MPKLFFLWITALCCALQLHAQPPAPDSIDKSRVMAWFQDQQYETAVQYIKERLQPGQTPQLALLGYAYYQWGHLAEAQDAYQQILQLDSLHIQALQYLGTIHMQKDNARQAIPCYQHLIRLQPRQALFYKQLALAYFSARQPDSGFVYLQQAYALNPLDPKVVARLGEEYLDREQYPAADSILNAHLAYDSLQSAVIGPAIKLAYFQKNYPRAIALGRRLMRLQVVSISAFTYVAAACYYAKAYQECIYVNNFLASMNAAPEAIMYYAALSYTALKDYTRSNQLLQQCIELARSRSLDDYYSAMSVNYEATRSYPKAIACLDTAYYLFHAPLRQYSIGRIYDQHLRNPKAAERHYRKYLQVAAPKEEERAIYKYVRERVK